jgi:hypothetical protein
LNDVTQAGLGLFINNVLILVEAEVEVVVVIFTVWFWRGNGIAKGNNRTWERNSNN